jgi:hypothetical protein
MGTSQEAIRNAIRGFADEINPIADRDSASEGVRSAQDESTPHQQGDRGSVFVHFGDNTTFGKGPLHHPDAAHHEHPLSRPESNHPHSGLADRLNLSLLMVSAILWFMSILTLYFVRYLPAFQSDALGLVGFLSLIGAFATLLLSLLQIKR